MPCDYKKYPANWKLITSHLKAKAGNRCELCYAPNGVMVSRNAGHWHPWDHGSDSVPAGSKLTKIILTVHHIDCDTENNDPKNLIVLCQRCHLRLDLFKHAQNRRRKRSHLVGWA